MKKFIENLSLFFIVISFFLLFVFILIDIWNYNDFNTQIILTSLASLLFFSVIAKIVSE